MFFTGPVVPPRYSVREVMTAWMTASTTGPPRFCSISAIAETGPISSKPTPAIADSVSGTTIMPMPIAADDDRQDQVREVRDAAVEGRAVDHGAEHQHSAGDDQDPRREARHQLRRAAQPDAQRDHERDEADARPQRAVAHDVLHVQADQHGQGEHDAAGQEDRDERGHPVAVAEQLERHDGVLGRALDEGERDEHDQRQPRPNRAW